MVQKISPSPNPNPKPSKQRHRYLGRVVVTSVVCLVVGGTTQGSSTTNQLSPVERVSGWTANY
ncbi:hypothetical protein [Mycoplasmoides pneumoniae]|uniref:hypothetical protein n=1 Tax=Mycoplasmoides pneumoniae TaxID=2104 RepID=UPI003A7F17E8